MKDESKIEKLAWILARSKFSESSQGASKETLRPGEGVSLQHTRDAQLAITDTELTQYTEGNRSSKIEQMLADKPEIRQRLVQLANLDQPTAQSVRTKIMNKALIKSQTRIQWAAAIALIGLGLILIQPFRSTEPETVSYEEFSSLEFTLDAHGLARTRGAEPATTSQVMALAETPIKIQIEASFSPSRALFFAIFHQHDQQWIQVENVSIEKAFGSALLTVKPSEFAANLLGPQTLIVAISHDPKFDVPAAGTNASTLTQSHSTSKLSSDRLFLVKVNIVKPDS